MSGFNQVQFVVGACLFVWSHVAQAQTTWHVDDDACPGPGTGSQVDPFCAIQAAIDSATGGDTILVEPGTYLENINFLGKAVTLRGTGGRDVTTIDGGGTGTVVTCDSGEGPDTVLEGFTLTGGAAASGGGMHNANASPTVTNCTFDGNQATEGAGMYNSNADPTVINCSFTGNVINGAGVGGGMYSLNSSPRVTNCMFVGNRNIFLAGGGMAVVGTSNLMVTNCTFIGNSSQIPGGGLYVSAMVQQLDPVANCIFRNNTPDSIVGAAGTLTVNFSNVHGGLSNVVGVTDGGGNIDADPLFVRNPDDGGDGFGDNLATPNIDESANDDYGDLRPLQGSPSINAGTPCWGVCSGGVNTGERCDDTSDCPDGICVGGADVCDPGVLIDFDGNDRVQHCRIDMGAFESPLPRSDCNGNGMDDRDCDESGDCDANGLADLCDPNFDDDMLIDECDPDIDNDTVLNDVDDCDFTPLGAPIQPDGTLLSDRDNDCDVDLVDFKVLQLEYTGPN